MSSQEQQDLDKFKAERAQIQDTAFNSMRDILRLSESELNLRFNGHITSERAVVLTYKYAQQRIDKLLAEHLRKYPD